jgi:hypothetical protein
VLTGREILERTAEVLGLRRPLILAVPFLSPALSSHWVRLVTRADWAVARELVVGLAHDLMAQDARYWTLIGHAHRLSFREAARRALEEDLGAREMNRFERAVEAAVGALAHADRGTPESTVANTGVQSVQAVELPMDSSSFEHWGQPRMMHRLLDAYFRVAERSSGGMMRVRSTPTGRTLTLRLLGVPLIVTGRPTLACDSARRAISVPVTGGMVAAPGGSARLAIVLTRDGTNVRLSVELTGYQPRGARFRPVSWIYRLQAGLHARVGRRFVRDCARAWGGAS